MKKTIILLIALFPLLASAQSSEKDLSSAKGIVERVRAQFASDARQSVYEVKAYYDSDGALVFGGNVSDSLSRNEIVRAADEQQLSYKNDIKVMPYDDWAQVRIPVASLRTQPRHAAEMATQAVLGTPLRVLDRSDDWWRVQTPDGYIAWVPSSSLVAKSDAEMAQWRKAKRFIVGDFWQIRAYNSPTTKSPRDVITDLVNGCIVTAPELKIENGRIGVELPDGRYGYVDYHTLMPIEQWAGQKFNADRILDVAYSMEGTPYLWGGTSTKAIDCSGLAKVSYFANGIILMRDASQQARTGYRMEPSQWPNFQAGDLLFFGNPKTGKVTHVAIYDSEGNYVHSSGRVKRNSVDPESPSYLNTPFLHAVRINGMEETPGIVRARNHPWFF